MGAACADPEGGSWTIFVIALSCAIGVGISYTGIWLQQLVTATGFMVLGCTCKLLVIVWGIVVDGDVSSPLAILGASLSLLGAFAYMG